MKKSEHFTSFKAFVLVVGIITGLFVLGSSSFYYQIKSTLAKSEKVVAVNETSESPVQGESVAAFELVSQNFNVQVEFNNFYRELPIEESNDSQDQSIFVDAVGIVKCILHVFGTAISPNAP